MSTIKEIALDELELEAVSKGNIIHADPTKDFFVNMITRDIALVDCIFDLLDNAIDGARRSMKQAPEKPFAGFTISLVFDRQKFSITDNCGGITLADAENHAFHFGRRPKGATDVKGGIGLYGIGMKRALFKIGRVANIQSHASDASFSVSVDVDDWMADEKSWDFTWAALTAKIEHGTSISINKLNPGIGDAFADPSFKTELVKAISRDYTFFIDKGLAINVDDTPVVSYQYGLKQNANIEPGVDEYDDDGVKIRIIAGLIEDLSDEIPDEARPGLVDRFGWYVICNDRVVLAGDKSSKTVWGNDDFQVWHLQYTGFAGFVFFQCDEQNKLPWTTTKRDLDESSPLYRRTIMRMKEMTEDFIRYSNRRKTELETAKQLESGSERVDVYSFRPQTDQVVRAPTLIRLPTLSSSSGPTMVNISFKRKKSEVDEIKEHNGNRFMSNKDVGHITFDYYREAELGK
jgi:hypothetical protein